MNPAEYFQDIVRYEGLAATDTAMWRNRNIVGQTELIERAKTP